MGVLNWSGYPDPSNPQKIPPPSLLSFVNQPGVLGQQAIGLAGGAGWKPGPGAPLYGGPMFSPGSDGSSGSSKGLFAPGGIIGGDTNQKFSSAGQGALLGMKYGSWPGAIIGGALGYGAAGGVKDANPIDASGFSGTTMDQAWANQNIARLASNPAASIASKLGVSSGSVLGTILDPASLFGGNKSHKRNWNAFNDAFPGTTVNNEGNYVLPKQFNNAVITQKQLDDLAGTWYGATYHPDGDQSGWEQKYNDTLTSIFGG